MRSWSNWLAVTNASQVESIVTSIMWRRQLLDILKNNASRGHNARGDCKTLNFNDIFDILDVKVVAAHLVI